MSEEGSPVSSFLVSFRAFGTPVPQGSMRAIGNKVFHDKSQSLIYWREIVATEARNEMRKLRLSPTEKAVLIGVHFYLKRPRTVSVAKRPLPITKPDLDKLVRAILDSLTGIVYSDDAQVVKMDVTKWYAESASEARVDISAREI